MKNMLTSKSPTTFESAICYHSSIAMGLIFKLRGHQIRATVYTVAPTLKHSGHTLTHSSIHVIFLSVTFLGFVVWIEGFKDILTPSNQIIS